MLEKGETNVILHSNLNNYFLHNFTKRNQKMVLCTSSVTGHSRTYRLDRRCFFRGKFFRQRPHLGNMVFIHDLPAHPMDDLPCRCGMVRGPRNKSYRTKGLERGKIIVRRSMQGRDLSNMWRYRRTFLGDVRCAFLEKRLRYRFFFLCRLSHL